MVDADVADGAKCEPARRRIVDADLVAVAEVIRVARVDREVEVSLRVRADAPAVARAMADVSAAENAAEVALTDFLEGETAGAGFGANDGRSVVEDEAGCSVVARGVATRSVLERVIAVLGSERDRGEWQCLVQCADAVVLLVAIEQRNRRLESARLKAIQWIVCLAIACREESAGAAREE